ncbi:hypothetical protein NTJ28_001799 [Flavobacterium psychrophilum]|nr:hypothetical protein [Flavobacterium psychrophilum]EKT4510654.1 hypothetical protein [Flavobacterium psychrophilum]
MNIKALLLRGRETIAEHRQIINYTSQSGEKITYSIISRGEMIIGYNNNAVNISIRVTGELIFHPPTFYADLVVLKRLTNLSEEIKKKIINFIESDSENTIGTKIIFE